MQPLNQKDAASMSQVKVSASSALLLASWPAMAGWQLDFNFTWQGQDWICRPSLRKHHMVHACGHEQFNQRRVAILLYYTQQDWMPASAQCKTLCGLLALALPAECFEVPLVGARRHAKGHGSIAMRCRVPGPNLPNTVACKGWSMSMLYSSPRHGAA